MAREVSYRNVMVDGQSYSESHGLDHELTASILDVMTAMERLGIQNVDIDVRKRTVGWQSNV